MGQFEDLKGKPLGGLNNGDGSRNDKNNESGYSTTNATDSTTTVDAPDVPNKEYFEFVVNTTKKTVRQEDALIRQILYNWYLVQILQILLIWESWHQQVKVKHTQ